MSRVMKLSGKFALTLAASVAAGSICSQALGQTLVTWIGPAASNWNNGTNWTGGSVPNGNFAVMIDNGAAQNSAVNLDISASIANLSISAGDQLNLGNNIQLTLNGVAGVASLNNAGTLSLNAVASSSNLNIAGGVTLSATGGGTIVLGTTGTGAAQITGGGTFVNVNNVIRGRGNIANNGMAFNNQHIIDADVTGASIFIDPVGAANGFQNGGTMTASNGGTLRINGQFGGGVTNTGTISAGNASFVSLEGGIGIGGGTFTTSGTGVVQVAGGNTAGLSSFGNLGHISVSNNAALDLGGDIFNAGSIDANAVASNSSIRINGTINLSGAGSINLGSTGAANGALGGSGTLNNINNRIRGFGELGQNSMYLNNGVAGVVDADTNGKALFVDPVAAGMTNAGNMRASNGGVLQFSGQFGGGVTNSGTISAANGSMVQMFGGFGVTGGTLTTSGTGTISVVDGNNVGFDSVSNTGNVSVGNNSTLNVTTAMTNSGSVNLSANASPSAVRFNNAMSLSGGGSFNLASAGAANAVLAGTGTLTNVNNRIRGFGELAQNQLFFINGAGGIVDADTTAKAIFVDPVSAGMNNAGIMRATNGGVLQFSGQFGGGLTNTGTIAATGANSEVQFYGGISISGGTLTSSTGGLLHVAGGQSAGFDALANTGTMLIDNNSTGNFTNQINNVGWINAIAQASPANFSVPAATTTTLVGGGTVTLSTVGTFAGNGRVTGSGTLVNTDNLIQGYGELGTNGLTVINGAAGVIDANVSARGLFVDPVTTGMTNNGSMRATNGGVLQLTGQFGGGVTNTGTILAANASNVQMFSSMSISGGTLTTTGSGTISVVPGNTVSLSNLANTGRIQGDNSTNLILGGTITNSATITLAAAGSDAALNPSGTVNLTGGGTVVLGTSGGGIARFGNGGGTFDTNNTIRGFGAIGSNNTAVINRGLISAAGGDVFVDPVNATNGFVNLGTLRVEPAASMGISGQFGGGVVSTGGLMQVQSGGTLNTFGGIGISGGSIELDGVWNHSSGNVSMAFMRGGGTLNLSGGAIAAVNPNGTNTGTSRIANVTIPGGTQPNSTLDLNDNDLILTAGNLQTVESQIAWARHGAAWDRPGLTSTAAKNSVPKNKNLGAISGADFHIAQGALSTFDGFAVADSDVLIKYTYNGDTDLNGAVNFDDYSRIDAGFNNNRSGWFNGDFDYNGVVNFDDYSLIDSAFNTQSGTLIRAMSYLDGGDRRTRGMDTPSLKLVMDHYAQFGEPYAAAFINAVPEPASALAVGALAMMTAARPVRRQRRSAVTPVRGA